MAKLNKQKKSFESQFQKPFIEEEGRNRCICCDKKLKEEDIHSVVLVRRIFCSPRCYIMSMKLMRDRQRDSLVYLCLKPDCYKQRHKRDDCNEYHDYCGKGHADSHAREVEGLFLIPGTTHQQHRHRHHHHKVSRRTNRGGDFVMEDIKGILRGRCSLRPCEQYKRSSEKEKVRSGECDHVPPNYVKLGRNVQTDGTGAARSSSAEHLTWEKYPSEEEEEEEEEDDDDEVEEEVEEVIEDVACSSGFLYSYQGCKNPSYFDVNTGECQSAYCEKHINLLPTHSLQAGISFSSVPIPQQLCKLPGCSRPANIDPDTNMAYDCCSKSHGRKLLELEQLRLCSTGQTPNTSMPPELKCQNPWCDRKRYQEPSSGTVYDFCGKTCRDNYRKLQKDGRGVTMPQSSKLCCLPGYKLPRHLNPSGECLKFCGNSHKSQAQRKVLLELTSDNKHYKKTLAYFISQWNINKSAPPSSHDVMMIFKIFNPKQKNIFTQYTQSLSSNTKTEKYFHGTSIICDVKTQKVACSNQKCGACGISSRGFDKKLIGSNIPRFMRFGKGFYLAPNSSKCHDYTQGIVDYRVMLLCEVAPGNKYKVTNDQTQLEGPPQGYDSVYGAKGGALNYDEIVLYCSDSILPKYVIVYKRDGINKIAK